MTNKLINIILNIIIFIIPVLALPRNESILYNVLKISALLICGAFLVVLLILKRKELKFDLIDKTLIAFYVLIIVSTIFSVNVKKAIIGEDNRYEGLLAFTVYFMTYYCAKYFFTFNQNIKKFAIATTLITSIIGILQYYNIFPIYHIFNIPYTVGFACSTFGNRNFFGSFLSIVVTLFMALYIVKKKKTYLILSYISFFAMLVTMTRSAWTGLGVASIFGLIYVIKNFNKDILKRTIYLCAGFIMIFIFVLFPPKFIKNSYFNVNLLSGRFEETFSDFNDMFGQKEDQNEMGSGRIEIWKNVLEVIAQSPLLGSGPDTLKDSLIIHNPLQVIERVNRIGSVIDKAHNEYLQIAATIGIPALIIYLAFLAQICAEQKNMFKDNSTFILLIPIISYMVQAFFNISTIGVAPIFYFLLGLIQNEKFKENLK